MHWAPAKGCEDHPRGWVTPATLQSGQGPGFPWPPPLRRPRWPARGPGERGRAGLERGGETATARPGAMAEGCHRDKPLKAISWRTEGCPWFRHTGQAILRAPPTAVEPLSEKNRRSRRWRAQPHRDARLGVAKVAKITCSSSGLGGDGARCWAPHGRARVDPPGAESIRSGRPASASSSSGATAANSRARPHCCTGWSAARGWGARFEEGSTAAGVELGRPSHAGSS